MLLYQAAIRTYWFSARILSLFNEKAARFVHGRKDLFRHLEKKIPQDKNVIWIHCASLGEFEQGRPLIEAWKKHHPEDFILLTFFSPSGYEVRKNYNMADYVCYLPVDTRKNVRKFIRLAHPQKAIFVKYEFWLNYIDILHEHNIPLYLVSGIFRKSQHFFRPFGKLFRQRLKKFSYFFLQNEASAKLLTSIDIHNHSVTGDTRFDRVAEIASQSASFRILENFSKDALVIVAGSTWPADEKLFVEHIAHQTSDKLKLIIAPHEVDQQHIQQLRNMLPDNTAFWSGCNNDLSLNSNVLVIDTIGILSSVYRYADIAYIGGGFGKGIHNTLEAATFGIPVVFGPNHQRFQEACELLKTGGSFSIGNSKEFGEQMNRLITDENYRRKAGEKAGKYVSERTGATHTIIAQISE